MINSNVSPSITNTSGHMVSKATSPVVSHPSLKIVFILGGPGVGKGTQCELAAKEFNQTNRLNSEKETSYSVVNGARITSLLHLSAGELLRGEMANPASPTGVEIAKCIAEGVIVPAEITVKLLRTEIENFARRLGDCDQSSSEKGSGRDVGIVLVDGFPRNLDNLNCWNRAADADTDGPCSSRVKNIVYFEASEDLLLARLQKRSITSQRTDDNRASIIKRFETFRRDTLPVLQLHDQINGLVVQTVPSSGSVEEVYTLFRHSLISFANGANHDC